MSKFKILHNPRCSKSRKALALLEEKKLDIELCEYLDNPLSKKELKELLAIANFEPVELVRSKEAKEEAGLGMADIRAMSSEELASFLSEHPKAMQRPVVIKDKNKASIARDEGWFNQL